MKIAIDLDGTAWKWQKEFIEIVKAFKSLGHEVGILTAHTPDFIEKDLKLWEHRGFPRADFYICKPKAETFIGEFKRQAIIENNINILFDDFGGNNPDIEKTFFENETGCLVMKVIGKEK